MAVQCTATTQKGEQCRQHSTVDASGLCLIHADDPTRKRQLAAARSRGGKTAAKRRIDGKIRTVDASEAPPAPQTIEDCATWASWAVHAVAVGSIDARTGDTVGKLLNALQRALKDGRLVEDVTTLRAQIAELRRAT